MEDRELKEKISELQEKIEQHEELPTTVAVRASEEDIPQSESSEDEVPSNDPDVSLPYWLFEAGTPVHDSIATRGCRIKVDAKRLRRCDEHTASARRSRNLYLVLLLFLFGGMIWLFATGHWIWAVIPLFGAVYTGLLSRAYQLVVDVDPYASGLLVPGTVVDPVQGKIVVLANVDCCDLENDLRQQRPAQWACRRICVKNLSPHQLKVGERVPCVALFGNPDETVQRYKFFNPYPLAWATADLEAINRDAERISQGEWNLLYCLSGVVCNHQPEIREDQLALFNKNRELIGIE